MKISIITKLKYCLKLFYLWQQNLLKSGSIKKVNDG